jgi:hypothetical protein
MLSVLHCASHGFSRGLRPTPPLIGRPPTFDAPEFVRRIPVTIRKTSAEAFPHIAGGGKMSF